jgi:hypothetical protein
LGKIWKKKYDNEIFWFYYNLRVVLFFLLPSASVCISNDVKLMLAMTFRVSFVFHIMIYWTTKKIFLTLTPAERLWFGIEGKPIGFHHFLLQKHFWQKITFKYDSAPSTRNHKYIKLVSFSRPPFVAARDPKWLARALCNQRKFLALEKLFLYPGFIYFCRILTFSSNRAEDDFRPKSLWLWRSVKLKSRRLSVMEYIHRRLYSPRSAICYTFPILFFF